MTQLGSANSAASISATDYAWRSARAAASASGAENEQRLKRRLWSDAAALRAVRAIGLRDGTIRRFRMGLKEPYLSRVTQLVTERALCFPVPHIDGSPASRWGCLNLDGVTRNPPHPIAWGAGGCRPYYSRAATAGSTLLVLSSILDLWLISQTLGEGYHGILAVCPSHAGLPTEWSHPEYWHRWGRVVLGVGSDTDGEEIAAAVARSGVADLVRCSAPNGDGWSDFIRAGASANEIVGLVRDAPQWSPLEPLEPFPEDLLTGEFHADPIAIEGAFISGRLHYPVTVEERAIESQTGAVAQRYVTRILRSDGRMLDVRLLPAPANTPRSCRVWSMSDGTRITAPPATGRFGSWRFSSIREFIATRAKGAPSAHRPLGRIVADVEEYLRSAVVLPRTEDFALIALFVAASFVHRLFDVLPILFVNGPAGSGKSELGQAIAAVSCNAVVAGRVSAAGLIRLLAESRGTVVLDDLERVARGGNDDIAQILKVSYKAGTAKRIAPGRDGRVEILDFFSPKVITNIAGCDAVLLSRALTVCIRPLASGAAAPERRFIDVAALRDEMHVWAMANASDVQTSYQPVAVTAATRLDEIAAPLRALATLVGEPALSQRLEVALTPTNLVVAVPVELVLRRAIDRLQGEGRLQLAMPHLQLEVAVEGGAAFVSPSAETIGRMLSGMGVLTEGSAADRRRLNGMPVRIYALRGDPDRTDIAAERDPFDFCRGRRCEACRYDDVCPKVLPGMRDRKS